jgi:ADP-ribose pyrophosphatase YjhB (NUDIX family)
MISQRDVAKGNVLVSVAAVIEGEKRKILLIWEGDTPYHKCWVTPGGYVKPDETVKQAVVREVREETGLEIFPTRLMGIYDDFVTDEKDVLIHHLIICYVAEIVGGELTVTLEAAEYAWMDVEEILRLSRVPKIFKTILDDFMKQKSKKFTSQLR